MAASNIKNDRSGQMPEGLVKAGVQRYHKSAGLR